SAAKTNIANALARSYFEGAQGDSLQAFDGLDLTATPRIRALISSEKVAFPAGENLILQLPFRPMGSLATAARELASAPKRRFTGRRQDDRARETQDRAVAEALSHGHVARRQRKRPLRYRAAIREARSPCRRRRHGHGRVRRHAQGRGLHGHRKRRECISAH